jgi:hypothetical protein
VGLKRSGWVLKVSGFGRCAQTHSVGTHESSRTHTRKHATRAHTHTYHKSINRNIKNIRKQRPSLLSKPVHDDKEYMHRPLSLSHPTTPTPIVKHTRPDPRTSRPSTPDPRAPPTRHLKTRRHDRLGKAPQRKTACWQSTRGRRQQVTRPQPQNTLLRSMTLRSRHLAPSVHQHVPPAFPTPRPRPWLICHTRLGVRTRMPPALLLRALSPSSAPRALARQEPELVLVENAADKVQKPPRTEHGA